MNRGVELALWICLNNTLIIFATYFYLNGELKYSIPLFLFIVEPLIKIWDLMEIKK